MKNSPRRALSTILAAALLLGSVPMGAQAQTVRIVSGQTGSMPISPVGAGGVNAAVMAPALNLGSANLATSFAPIIAPSLIGGSVQAAAAQPVNGAVAVPSALTASPLSAASSGDAPKLPDAPKAATPAAKTTWTARIAALLGRKPATEKPVPSAETAKSNADKTFDGSAEKTGEAASPVAGAENTSRLSGLKAAVSTKVSARVALSAAKRAATVDEFGGPLAEPMTFKQRVGFGLKQGLHLIGIGAILEMTLRPFLSLFPWPQYLGDAALRGFGRVALLTNFGPNEIVEGLAQSPLGFMGFSLPWAVTMEELTYRLLGFGVTFLMIAGIKPLSRLISSMIEGLPDAAGIVGASKKVLRGAEWISRLAFPLAAGISSLNFAIAHFANWGFSPYVFALNFLVGLFLAHTAYKSRSLTSPIVAHLVFNLVAVGSILLAVVTSPMTGAAFSIIAGLIGVAALLHSWLTARKERMFLLKSKGLATLMVGIMGTSLLFNGMPNTAKVDPSVVNAAITQVQDKTVTAVAPVAGTVATAKPDTAAVVESRSDMVARVKPSVVNVIIRMGKGMAIGSGFILTPNGIFVTNGHVVGDKKPGDFVNAKVPGVPGELRAKVLAVNHDKDLAIVQLQPRPDGKPWPTVKLASEAPREGDEVIAMGYPRGLPFTVSQGVVSGLDDRGTTYVRKLQTDAAINPGNSGGPLFNTKGEVVGVNTEIATQSGGSEGLGFSIQAPEVAHIMEQYAHTGNIATASLGIISNLSDPMAPEAGLEIEYVRHGSAAEKAGLKRGDLIIGVADQSIEEGGQQGAGHIAAVLSKIMPGQKVSVTVLRGDEPLEIEVTADAKATFAPSH